MIHLKAITGLKRERCLMLPKMFGVPITERCHLRCHFCFNSDEYFKESKHMELEDFKNIVNWLIENNIKHIDITPTVGEALLIPNLGDFLDFLDESVIESYTLITTLTLDPSALMNREKLNLEISLYGSTKEEYKTVTKKDLFINVMNNIRLLLYNSERFSIIKRYKSDEDLKLKTLLSFENINLVELSDNRGLSRKEGNEIKRCKFMNEPVVTSKGLSLCCMDYKSDSLLIGKVGDNLNELYDNLFKTISNNKLECSVNCDWFTDE